MNFVMRIAPVLLILSSAACHATGTGTEATAALTERVALEIKTAAGVRTFKVEVARTPEQQERGLMFRTSLPDDGGMIFPIAVPREASFWMKNTVIPLDMIFIRSDGTIARIADNTIPYDLTPVSSGEPVTAVLELAGGKAAALGIAEGDRVIWKSAGE